MFPLMDGREHRLLKERMKAMEMKAGQESGIELKGQESGSLCDVFLLLRDCTECFFLLLLFGMWNVQGRERRCVMIDGRIRTWPYFRHTLLSLLIVLARTKRRRCALSIPEAIRCRIPTIANI